MYDYHMCHDKDILCIDQKSFFASCSCIQKGLDPLKVKLAVVADTKHQGSVVLAATPSLKAMGIKTGSRLFEIPHRSDIYIINPSMNLYLDIASRISAIALKYVAPEDFHQYSIDEFFLDVTQTYQLFSKSVQEFAKMIKEEIYKETKINCAVGIGSNMLLSKLALDFEAKKMTNGIAEWRYQHVPEKLWPIEPLHHFWGINHRMERRLNKKGIFTIGDLAHYPHHYLKRDFGIIGVDLHLHANGIDSSIIKEKYTTYRPSINKSQILMRDFYFDELKVIILEQAEEVAFRLRARNQLAKTIHFSVGYSDEGKVSKSYTLQEGTNLTNDIFRIVWGFLTQLADKKRTFRTVSVSLTNFLREEERQLTLFIDEFERFKEERLMKTLDQIRRKYGTTSVIRASSKTKAGTALARSNLVAGHKA